MLHGEIEKSIPGFSNFAIVYNITKLRVCCTIFLTSEKLDETNALWLRAEKELLSNAPGVLHPGGNEGGNDRKK